MYKKVSISTSEILLYFINYTENHTTKIVDTRCLKDLSLRHSWTRSFKKGRQKHIIEAILVLCKTVKRHIVIGNFIAQDFLSGVNILHFFPLAGK